MLSSKPCPTPQRMAECNKRSVASSKLALHNHLNWLRRTKYLSSADNLMVFQIKGGLQESTFMTEITGRHQNVRKVPVLRLSVMTCVFDCQKTCRSGRFCQTKTWCLFLTVRHGWPLICYWKWDTPRWGLASRGLGAVCILLQLFWYNIDVMTHLPTPYLSALKEKDLFLYRSSSNQRESLK